MVTVAADDLAPFGGEPALGFRGVPLQARHRVLELQPSPPGKARPSAGDLTTQRGDQLRLAVALDLEVDRAALEVGREAKPADMAPGQGLEPDRLPDPGRRCVEDALRDLLPVLLAARDGQIVERVFGADDEHVVAPAHDPSDVGAERDMPSFVAGNLHVVDPNSRAIVDRSEMQDAAFGLRRVKASPMTDVVAPY